MKSLKVFSLVLVAALCGALGSKVIDSAYAASPPVHIVSATVDLASQADGVGSTNAITVPGAALGDACLASVGVDSVDMTITCTVVAANSAEVRVQNESASTVDLASTTFRVFLFKKTVN